MTAFPGFSITGTIRDSNSITIYRGRRIKDGLPVILKSYPEKCPSSERIKRCSREYERLRGLDSPFILNLQDLFNFEGHTVVVFEDFGGRSLRELMKGEKFDTRRFLRLSRGIAEALDAIHQANLVHMALNPENIMVLPKTDQIKLSDFGLSIRLDIETPGVTGRNLFMTDPLYISPEQTGRIHLPLDQRSDLYSLGIVMFEMSAGRPPFKGGGPWEIAWNHLAQPAPLHELYSNTPKQVSHIIRKLLAKDPEDRYRSAAALKKDLDTCLNLLLKTGELPEFSLQKRRLTERFQLSGKLYGRVKELKVLKEVYEDVRSGAGRLMLVAGYAGIGKTSLVNEIQKTVIENGGRFVSGKYEQLQKNIPYTGLLQALTRLLVELYCAGEAELNLRLTRIREALGPNSGVMTEFLPEFENILGPQPPPVKTGPIETRNRFHDVFTRFIHQFCRSEQPLVLFLDDLQWVDQATLNLIEALLTHPETGHLLVLGAYRDNEVDSNHILAKSYRQMKSRGARVDRLDLGPLGLPDVIDLIHDSLTADPRTTDDLAEFAFGKTGGNPFFLTQLLKSLHLEGILHFDRKHLRWDWSPVKAQTLDLSDDILDFLSTKLGHLPQDTQRALALAACIGFDFDLSHLSFISDQSLTQAYNHLFTAVRAGLILPRSELEPSDPDAPHSPLIVFQYRFLHDRIEQAAYEAMDHSERQAVHLAIGRRMLETLNDEEHRDRIFELADHLNKGRERITDDTEKTTLARVNLQAAQKAIGALAFDAAAAYLDVAGEALPPDAWQNDYPLAFRLYRESAAVACLNNRFPQSQNLIDICLAQAESIPDKVEIYALAIFKYFMEGDNASVLSTGKKALNLFDIEIPNEITPALLEKEQIEVMNLIGNRDIASLVDLPLNTDPKWDSAFVIINALGKILLGIDPNFFSWLSLYGLKLPLRHGHIKDAITIFAVNGNMQIARGNIDFGYELGLLSIELSSIFNNLSQKTFIFNIFACYVQPWKRHIRESRFYLEECCKTGQMVGEYFYVGSSLANIVINELIQGRKPDDVHIRLQQYLDFEKRIRIPYLRHLGSLLKMITDDLSGLSPAPSNFDPEFSDEKTLLQSCKNQQKDYALALYHVLKSMMLYIHGQPASSLESLRESDQYLPFLSRHIFAAEQAFYYALSLAALYPDASPEDRKQYMEKMQDCRGKLGFWAGHCPENFSCRHFLVEAEIARITGRELEAADSYEKAIAAAIENEFTQVEALANERAGRFWLARGNDRIAGMYLNEAHGGWHRWGAKHKIELFEKEFLDYFLPGVEAGRPALDQVPVESDGLSSNPEPWDKTTITEAVRIVSGETDMDRLTGNLIKMLVRYSGAQKGWLIVRNGDGFVIRAREEAGRPEPDSTLPQSVDDCRDVCRAVVHYVARSRTPVVLGDAVREGDFVHDDYVIKNRVRSVLGLPVINQGLLMGVLYLENNLLPDVFTPDRLETIQILAPLFALSLDNQELRTRVDKQSQSLEEANAALKVLLAERDRDRGEQEKNLLATLRQIVLPYTEKLKSTNLTAEQTTHLDIIESNLLNLAASFARHLSSPEFGLTPMEMQVAELIKNGRTSDEIADLLHVSSGTVSFHRTNIRTKLGLIGKRVNLRSYLISLTSE